MMKQVNFRIPCRVYALILGLLISLGTFAQQITVKGHIKDAAGEAIIGANVKVVGATMGTVSDFDGNFTLTAQKGTNLVISYIGYTSKTLAAEPDLMITLQEDQKMLDNVVVIGYGTVKKSDATDRKSVV